MPPKEAVVTDNTCIIPEAMLKAAGIQTVPLQVIWGSQIYRDGINITSESVLNTFKSTRTPHNLTGDSGGC